MYFFKPSRWLIFVTGKILKLKCQYMKYLLLFKISLLLSCFGVALEVEIQAQPIDPQSLIVAIDDTVTISTPIEQVYFEEIDVLANDVLPDSAIVLVIPTEPEYGLAHWNSFSNTMQYVPFEFGEEGFVDQFDYTIHICYVGSSDTLWTNTATVTIVAECAIDCVWPGDIKNNGRANVWDVLPIGLSYGETGPSRGVPNILWLPQQGSDWQDSLEVDTDEFLNYKHIDANGDGIINENDVAAIDQNYALTHTKKGQSQVEDADFAILLDFLTDSISIGDTVTANIILSESGDTSNIYGLAFSVNHNIEDSGSMQVDFPPSFIGNDQNTVSLQKNLGNGRIEAALTRIDKQNTGGSGVFGVLTFIMEDFVDGKKKIASQQITMDISDVRAINNLGEDIPIIGVGDVAFFDDTTTGIEDRVIDHALDFYPNPTQNNLFINLKDLQSTDVLIHNLMGKTMLSKSIGIHQASIELSLKGWKPGMYLLQVNTKKGIISKRIIIF